MNRLRFQPARFALLLIPLLCFGRSPKLAPDLDNVDPQSTVDVIVQFATPADNEQHQKINQLGGLLRADLELIQGAVYSIPAAALTGLANNPNVLYISPDRQVTATLDYADPTLGAPTALLNGWDGTGVGIAMIDSGIQGARDLLDQTNPSSNVSRIVYSESFVPRVTSVADQYGHGTHVAGIVAGNGTASTGTNYFVEVLRENCRNS